MISRQRKWQLKMKKQGCCQDCGTPTDKRARCVRCAANRRVYQIERAIVLGRAKICVGCGWRPVENNRHYCTECRQYHKVYQKKRRATLKRRGLCVECMEPRLSRSVCCADCLCKRRVAERKRGKFKAHKPGGRGRPPIEGEER